MGFGLSINRIVTFVVLIVVGLLLIQGLLSEGGWLSEIKEVILDLGVETEFGAGLDEIQAEPVSISETHQKEIDSFQAGLNVMLKEREYGNVFYYFGGFSSFEDGIEIVLTKNGENVEMIVRSGAGNKQTYSEETVTIENMGLCVIAGSGVSNNFYDKFLEPSEVSDDSEYHSIVDYIRIVYAAPWLSINGNKIDYGEGLVDFGGNEWLFSPNNKDICFFPTKMDGTLCDGSREKLDDACFKDNSGSWSSMISDNYKTTIPYRVQNSLVNSPGSKSK